jgi:hypothetical protein
MSQILVEDKEVPEERAASGGIEAQIEHEISA